MRLSGEQGVESSRIRQAERHQRCVRFGGPQEHYGRGPIKAMKVRYSKMIEELTGRKVLAFLSQAPVEPDLTVEMFLLDGPVSEFGALELVELGPAE